MRLTIIVVAAALALAACGDGGQEIPAEPAGAVEDNLPMASTTSTTAAPVTTTTSQATTTSTTAAPATTAAPTTTAAPPPTTAAAEPYYANCTEAREAGAAPLHRGEPGYRPEMDRDNDGIACE